MKQLVALMVSVLAAGAAHAKCEGLPSYDSFKKALVSARQADNGGLNLEMWGTLVDRQGNVCMIAYTGEKVDSQWLGSRVISAQKANTANAFSLKGLSLSTANLYSAVQPGGSLFGLQESNPVNTQVAYKGDAARYGSNKDPMVGEKVGGVNVFGGGLALYNAKGEIVGALGVSGDTSCADHAIAWRLRNTLELDYVPAGVSPQMNDNIIYDIKDGKSAAGFGHPACGGKEVELASTLPASRSLKK
ncbi:MAG: heme-binding protein [Bdellovibrionaceae bacterium]|nr:heme-binding protein [Pseudobdellovibrionaceae bacterium]